jgi:hypothetical protein
VAKSKFAVELKAGKSPAAFMAGDKRIVLDDANPRFETSDEAVYRGLLDLPFLKDAGEVKTEKSEAGS